MRLADELMHLRVRGHVHDEVDLRILDAADAAVERRVGPREILESVLKSSVQVFSRLSTPTPSGRPPEPEREVRTDLADEPVRRTRIGKPCQSRRYAATSASRRAAQRRRRRALDRDLDELARRGVRRS